jgi:multidrug efflux system outer membrane protein
VDRAQAALAQAESALAAPREAINASAQQLALLLGQNHPDAAWLQPGQPLELGRWKIDSAPADLLRSRPEIARAEADVLTAAGELATAHADRFPRIGLGGSINWSTDIDNNHTRSNTPNAIDSFGPEISIPLFDWGIRLAAEHARDHQLKASVLAYRQAVLQGVSAVETALGSVQQQRLREQHSRQAWQALQRADQVVQTRTTLALASPLDRNESRMDADRAALDLADARAAHDLAYVALFKALGGAPLPAAGDPDEASH